MDSDESNEDSEESGQENQVDSLTDKYGVRIGSGMDFEETRGIEGEHGTTVQGDIGRIDKFDVDPADDSGGGWLTYGEDYEQTRNKSFEDVFRSPTVVRDVSKLVEEVQKESGRSPEVSIGRIAEELDDSVDRAKAKDEVQGLGPKAKRAAVFLLTTFVITAGTNDLTIGATSGTVAAEMFEILHESIAKSGEGV